MSLHERWLCGLCQREWLHAQEFEGNGYRPWVEADGCPRCRSNDIKLVKYEPQFYGGDIPRGEPLFDPEVVLAASQEVTARRMAGADWARLEADAKEARRNQTLDMASASPELL